MIFCNVLLSITFDAFGRCADRADGTVITITGKTILKPAKPLKAAVMQA